MFISNLRLIKSCINRCLTFISVVFLFFFIFNNLAGCKAPAVINQDTSKSAENSANTSISTTASKTVSTSQKSADKSTGLNSIEAAQLVWPKAKSNFGDAVLFRMAPVADKDSTKLMLNSDWQKTGRSANWFIWYADPDGQDWLMFAIKGNKLDKTDIGTRGWSVISMGADWPREQPAIAIEDAAAAASEQGANLDSLTWVELSCDYPASDYRGHQYWVFACSDMTGSGLALNYRIFVDAKTGKAAGALNDRNEKLSLPINLASLETVRKNNHEADLQKFFNLIINKDWTFTIFQLSYNMAPDDASRQMWLSNFQSLNSLEVVSIEPANLVQWTDEWESYKVILKIKTNEPVDKYGWENGENTRWMTIIPQGAGDWKIGAISSSP